MTRMADATMVWSRAARNIPIMSPMRIVTIWRWVSGSSRPTTGRAAVDLRLLKRVRLGDVKARKGPEDRGLEEGIVKAAGMPGSPGPQSAGGVGLVGRSPAGVERVGEAAEVGDETSDLIGFPPGQDLRQPLAAGAHDLTKRGAALVCEG